MRSKGTEMFEFTLNVVGSCLGYRQHVQHRKDHDSIQATPESYEALRKTQVELELYSESQKNFVVEKFTEFSICHIEFDDQGQYWDRKQFATTAQVLNPPLDPDEEESGVLIVCFVHGWQNNGLYNNGNLQSFRALLSSLYATEKTICEDENRSRTLQYQQENSESAGQELPETKRRKRRRVVGVYLSWRGQSQRIPVFSQLTYWNRKQTAHKIGNGDLLDALTRIEQIRFHPRHDGPRSRQIIIGHSFGGAAVFSATAPFIRTKAIEEDQTAQLDSAKHVAKIEGFGDLIVLVNPAFEALLYAPFNQLSETILRYDPTQHVVLMTVGAENDKATKKPFWIGQTLGRYFQRRQHSELELMTTTAANYQPFITHELKPQTADKKYSEIGGEETAIQSWEASAPKVRATSWSDFLPPNRDWVLDVIRNPPPPVNHAFMTVRAKETVVDGHSGIFKSIFIEFFRDFVIAQDRYSDSLQKRPASKPPC